jgi:NAD(P)-dependent dehydrogenase (short-subunit alcohol dehydrogenase family)
MPKFSPRRAARSPRATKSAHFRRTTVANEPSPSMQAVLRPQLLHGVGITLSGNPAPEIRERLTDLGATNGTDVLVHAATPPTNADEARAALDDAWDAIRAHKLPPSPGLIVLLSPPPTNPHAHAARAGLENLARTLSTEWARHGTRTVTIHQAGNPHATAELTAFLASPAGGYYAGCAFTLR